MTTGFWFSHEVIESTNIHKAPSVILYSSITLFAVFLSFYYRKKYSYFVIDEKGIERKGNWYTLPFIGFDEIVKIEESRGEFFGKTSRFLHIELRNGEILEIYDFIFKYNDIRKILEKKQRIFSSPLLTGGYFVNFANENYQTLSEKLSEQSNQRDRIFGDPASIRSRVFEGIKRLICLIPVCTTDFYTKLIIDQSFGYDREIPLPLSYYSSAISLFVSMMVARYIYFYLFSYEKFSIPKHSPKF